MSIGLLVVPKALKLINYKFFERRFMDKLISVVRVNFVNLKQRVS